MATRPGAGRPAVRGPGATRSLARGRSPADAAKVAPALDRSSLILVVTDDGSDPAYARTRRAAIELARTSGGRILFYDRSAESRFVDPYASGPLTSDNEGSHGERMLDPAELRALGRDYLSEDVGEAAASGVAAWAWLPRRTGARAIAEAVERFGCDLIVVPAELGRSVVIDRPWLRAPRSAVGVPLLLSSPDGSLGAWQLATEASRVGFEVRQLGLLRVRGRFAEFDVRLALDEADPEATHVEARIVAASLTTGLAVRDRALRGRSYFDVEHHPYITFVSSAVSRSGSAYRVSGLLTIKGRGRQVELRGGSGGIADAGGYRRATMHLTAEVDRHDWDLSGGFAIADRATLTIDAVAVRASSEPPVDPDAAGRAPTG